MIGKNSMKHYPKKKDFYSRLNMEDITDADYTHTKRVCKDFERKKFGEYHDYTMIYMFKVIRYCLFSINATNTHKH